MWRDMTPDRDPRNVRFHALDGIRGYAALTVIVYHCLLSLDSTLWHKYDALSILGVSNINEFLSKFALVIFNGDAAVVIFFILSGFVLSRTLIYDLHRFSVTSAMQAFMVRRFLRLYPAMLASLIFAISILILVFYIFNISLSEFYFRPRNFIRNALLIAPEVSGVTWSILVEFAAIPFIALFAFFVFRFGAPAALLFIGIALVIRAVGGFPFNYLKFHLYLICFALGVFLSISQGIRFVSYFSKIKTIYILAIFIFISLFLSSSLIQIVFGFVLISRFIDDEDPLSPMLANRTSVYFGRISYGLYLFHYPLAIAAYTPFAVYTPWVFGDYAIWYGLLIVPVVLLVTIGLADLSERYLERPFIRLGHRLSASLQRPRPGP